ncbi:MAG: hypothetical protein M1818_003060 [Claussenomyces sp. TS43310]|nr:MAG: hypothetical protein M1818_003060 [Claussenomyces sp. TS43310]
MSSEDYDFLKPLKTKFTRADSAVAFPRRLGFQLGVPERPRLHSFAWNVGSRPVEPSSLPGSRILEMITFQDLQIYSSIYFSTIHEVFGFLDRAAFERRVCSYCNAQEPDLGFDSVICGVVALGSFFAGSNTCHCESDIVEQGRLLLEMSASKPPLVLSIDLVAGWILRTIYLRCTTRPYLSWMAICTTMHLLEALGLHQEMGEIKMIRNRDRPITATEVEIRRRTFWVANSLNQLFAAEYGRTSIKLDTVSSQLPKEEEGDMTSEFVTLTQLLQDQSLQTSSKTSEEELAKLLFKVARKPAISLPFSLFKADIAFCIYRKLKFLELTISPSGSNLILSIIRPALAASRSLSTNHQPWWNVIGIPFQSICTLVSMGTSESLDLLPDAMEILQCVASVYDTLYAREAVGMARLLITTAKSKKSKQLDSIDRALRSAQMSDAADLSSEPPWTDVTNRVHDPPNFQWPTDNDLGWATLFDAGQFPEDAFGQ